MADITIVGGGLAGMIAALKLSDAQRGCNVTLYESSHRLGGKAGSDFVDGYWIDHGFHIYPQWYVNLWRIIDDIGFRENYVPLTILNQLEAGQFPDFKYTDNLASIKTFPHNLFSGIMPVPDMFLFFYTGLDLMSQKFERGVFLDEISFSGFVHSRWYADEDAVHEFQDLLLKVASAPTYRFSTMTMQNLLNFWTKYPDPMYHITNGPLQEKFITPIQRQLEQQGVTIKFFHKLTAINAERGDDGLARAKTLIFEQTQHQEQIAVDVSNLILALQPVDIIPLLNDALYDDAAELFSVEYLDEEPMAALNIYTRNKIAGLPSQHVTLTDSAYQLSFIDVSQTWGGFDSTALNCVASDYTLLKNVTPEEATQAIIAEMRRFIPGLEDDNIAYTYMQPHLDQPLFMNYVASWDYRPSSDKATGLANMVLAGDYCQTQVDLATMESATESGLRAAETMRKLIGNPNQIEILSIDIYPRWLMGVGKVLALPLAAVAKLWSDALKLGDGKRG